MEIHKAKSENFCELRYLTILNLWLICFFQVKMQLGKLDTNEVLSSVGVPQKSTEILTTAKNAKESQEPGTERRGKRGT